MLSERIKTGQNFYSVVKQKEQNPGSKPASRLVTPLPNELGGEGRKRVSEPVALLGLNKIKEVPKDNSEKNSAPSPRTLLELQRKNMERLMNKRERMNHTTADGWHYNHNK